MTSLLESRDIRVFDDTKWAEPLREAIRSNAETIAASAGINERAQALADDFDVSRLHQRLDDLPRRYCPVIEAVQTGYHWSLMQVEYSTDIVFRNQTDLAPIDETLVRTSVDAVKPEHVATFLGRKLHGHYRKVEQKDGSTKFKLAPVRKTVYSLLPDLRELLAAANRRYFELLSALDDPSCGIRALEKTTQPTSDNGRTHRGLHFFATPDQQLIEVLGRAEVSVAGVGNRDMRQSIEDYLTDLGRRVLFAGLDLKEFFLIAALAEATTASFFADRLTTTPVTD